MNTTVADYLLGPRGVWARIAVSAWCLVVSVVVFFVSPAGLGVSAAWLAVVLAWCGVVAASHRRACARAAASISAPNAEQLAADARDGRRHAVEFGLPIDPWTQLEGFWCAAGDLSLRIDELEQVGEQPPDPFMDELRFGMLAPLSVPVADPDGKHRLPEDDPPSDLDAFVERTHRKYGPPERRTHQDHLAIEADVDAYAARATRRRKYQPLRPEAAEVQIVCAGRVLTPAPTHDPVVRCTWRLAGTAEDRHAIRALRAAGVQVAVEDNGPGAAVEKVAHLVGAQSAINEAHATYMRGLRERAAAGKVTGR